jgi:hypothetical protein
LDLHLDADRVLSIRELTRERVPLDWAMTQMNLGAALARLGERESGTAHLEQAVEGYRLALESGISGNHLGNRSTLN